MSGEMVGGSVGRSSMTGPGRQQWGSAKEGSNMARAVLQADSSWHGPEGIEAGEWHRGQAVVEDADDGT